MDTNKVTRIQNTHISYHNTSKTSNGSKDFHHIFEEEANVQFSKHANMRLSNRNINFSLEEIQRIESGITKARTKGINNSLVLMDNTALVVNIRSGTVITAMEKESQNVFTNIDGAVIV